MIWLRWHSGKPHSADMPRWKPNAQTPQERNEYNAVKSEQYQWREWLFLEMCDSRIGHRHPSIGWPTHTSYTHTGHIKVLSITLFFYHMVYLGREKSSTSNTVCSFLFKAHPELPLSMHCLVALFFWVVHVSFVLFQCSWCNYNFMHSQSLFRLSPLLRIAFLRSSPSGFLQYVFIRDLVKPLGV